MNLFSSLRISQKIMLLVAWLGFGFAALGVVYYLQVEKESESRSRFKYFSSFEKTLVQINVDLRAYLSAHAAYQKEPGETRQATWQDSRKRLANALAEAQKQVLKESALPDISLLGRAFSALDKTAAAVLDNKSTNTQAVAVPVWSVDKIQAAYSAIETLVNQRNKPAEINGLAKLGSLQTAFFDSHAQNSAGAEALAQLKNFAQDFATTLLAVVRPDPLQIQLIDLLGNYQRELPQTLTAPVATVLVEPLAPALVEEFNKQLAGLARALEARASNYDVAEELRLQYIRGAFIGLIFVVVMGTAIGIYFIYKSIVFPMAHIQNVIQRINKGSTKARVKLLSEDELGDLGRAFNRLLDERFQNLQGQALENDILNNSIISLIKAVGLIARKDLTIKVPVSSDITGTVSDAINLLTTETAKTLWQVKEISVSVNEVADTLQKQSLLVMQVAEDERKQVIAAGKALEISAKTMNDIAKNADNADKFALVAIDNTLAARDTVARSVAGILEIRETISETEKRLKRLGDRSQEISGIVNLINTIAERTHILALNASMHAASAGEAGKGFAVVADEVQRLAENAREATAEISSMVNNIRVETSDTVNIMNKLISQVAEGTRLAESAGQKMEDTVAVTRQLVERVQVIAQSSLQQAELSNRVRDRASIIRSFTEKTGLQLTQQKRHTDSLKHYSETLVERVNIFSLPQFQDGVRVSNI